ncbi:MAG: TM0106 family RecB-like putative nuclease [Candidatus Lokiarchaeota archaeon]|nr:TM0106 family RecB-like putative nuclease [Candidatus Lokiarchaeota archaeon]MBD3199207.1 TM0106 family RecB-like putative nuclease [Candidatus Lokiarchaeota archaeon]
MRFFQKIPEIEISATDVFEYVKCPAFYKQYISSEKKLEECYDDFYHNIIFQTGKEFEMEELKKLSLVNNTKSLNDALKDEDSSILKLSPEIILKREFSFLDKKIKRSRKINAIGKPDLLIKDSTTNKFIPLEYKTSLRFFNSLRFQLFHYCYILQGFDPLIPYLGALKSEDLNTIFFNLADLKSEWKKLMSSIFAVKIGKGFIRDLKREDIKWTKECRMCVFRQKCENIIKLKPNIKNLPEVGNRRYQMITDLGITSIQELAKEDPKAMWERLIKIPQGKSVFNRELTVIQIINTAKALLENRIIIFSEKLESLNLDTKDGFFDMEYESNLTAPIIFSISLGCFGKNGSLQIKTWFAESLNEVKTIVSNFYNFMIDKGIKRVFGWGINSGDLPQLKKIQQLPSEIIFYDLYFKIKENFAIPILSYRLKSVSKFLFGNQFQGEINLGTAAIDLYRKYLKTPDSLYKEKIIDYNKRDVLQTYEIARWYENYCIGQ